MRALRRTAAWVRFCEKHERKTMAGEPCRVCSAAQLCAAMGGAQAPVGMVPASQMQKQTNRCTQRGFPRCAKLVEDIPNPVNSVRVFTDCAPSVGWSRESGTLIPLASGRGGVPHRASDPAIYRITTREACENARRESPSSGSEVGKRVEPVMERFLRS